MVVKNATGVAAPAAAGLSVYSQEAACSNTVRSSTIPVVVLGNTGINLLISQATFLLKIRSLFIAIVFIRPSPF